ncbi:SDR family NAD(P)-dependent oxidoreductase [Mumia zhuanghuii]|uniref:SDR family NAD(P)-dependent oxidoreductase n=1 Tax=Mumia zhuanghuii TaxID=2585211 RepID=A0A5C4MYW2_9ACTN|nr:SDR family NAD(P)-dependent oxidoreductase [Mumia zhuanghuii]TNC51382.1 SDR family NAD(P)-dependent oxidoreductase [Mumia zhuanghuii]
MALVLVTGASTGLGLATATALAADGHDVVLHARNAGRLEDPSVLDRMYGVVYGDLSLPEETVEVGRQADVIGRFDAVVHNAGVMRGGDVLAVNTVAPFVLTATMTPPERAIFLSSGMHFSGSPQRLEPDFAAPGRTSYADSKLFVTALALALARRWPQTVSHAVDPGWVPTRMGGPSAPESLEDGRTTQVWLATAEEDSIDPRTGGYWYHEAVRAPHAATSDPRFQDAVVDVLEARTGFALPR